MRRRRKDKGMGREHSSSPQKSLFLLLLPSSGVERRAAARLLFPPWWGPALTLSVTISLAILPRVTVLFLADVPPSGWPTALLLILLILLLLLLLLVVLIRMLLVLLEPLLLSAVAKLTRSLAPTASAPLLLPLSLSLSLSLMLMLVYALMLATILVLVLLFVVLVITEARVAFLKLLLIFGLVLAWSLLRPSTVLLLLLLLVLVLRYMRICPWSSSPTCLIGHGRRVRSRIISRIRILVSNAHAPKPSDSRLTLAPSRTFLPLACIGDLNVEAFFPLRLSLGLGSGQWLLRRN